jgi:quercetin dioxygenase-like cupin family protein
MEGRKLHLEGPLNRSEFEAQLKAEGYQEIELQELAPRPGKGRHRHHFAIRGLVLSGAFIVTQDSDPVTYGPGQIFAVGEGECMTSRSDRTARAW